MVDVELRWEGRGKNEEHEDDGVEKVDFPEVSLPAQTKEENQG